MSMRAHCLPIYLLPVLAIVLAGCGDKSRLAGNADMGMQPVLAEPHHSLVPTIEIAPAKGWADGTAPKPAAGLAVNAFARGLDHPRWLYVLPNGDVLVAETNAPPKPDDNKGIKGYFFKKFQAKAGGAVPSANRITLLRDTDGDGVADMRSVLIDSLNGPFGMALVGN